MSGVFTAVVCPVIGNCLGICMLLAPTPAVLQAKRTQRLGALNVLPYPLTAINCIGWIAYGLVIPNLWIIPANVIGVCAGLWFSLVALPLMDRKGQDRMVALCVGSAGFFCILAIIGMFALDSAGRIRMWGLEALVVLLLYYGIPLSTMWEVIKARNGASIYLPLAIAAVANGSLWTLYGLFATHDYNVWMPNGVGVLLGLVQIGLRLRYGSRDLDLADSHLIPAQDSVTLSESLSNPPVWRGLSDPRMLLLGSHKSNSDSNLNHSFNSQPSGKHSRLELNSLHHDLSLMAPHHEYKVVHQDMEIVDLGTNGVVHINGLHEDAAVHLLHEGPLRVEHVGMHVVDSAPAIVQHTAGIANGP